MSTNKTQHYHLHAWEPSDDFLRTEINENFAMLDTAVKAETDARVAAVQAEADARAAAVKAEADARAALKTSLENAVKAETDARKTAVKGEASARASLKTSLEGKISTVKTDLAGRGRWVTGTYTGNDAKSREIKLAGPILALILENQYGFRGQGASYTFGGLVLPGAPLNENKGRVSGSSFFVTAEYLNITNNSYRYLALVDLP